ncbi:hypothetical protein YC2023_027276 [Brassica napus]
MSLKTKTSTVVHRAFHHYRGQKEPIEKRPELEKLLKEEYRSIADFPNNGSHITSQKENKSQDEEERRIICLPLSK